MVIEEAGRYEEAAMCGRPPFCLRRAARASHPAEDASCLPTLLRRPCRSCPHQTLCGQLVDRFTQPTDLHIRAPAGSDDIELLLDTEVVPTLEKPLRRLVAGTEVVLQYLCDARREIQLFTQHGHDMLFRHAHT